MHWLENILKKKKPLSTIEKGQSYLTTKNVKIKITYRNFLEDIIEEVSVQVPVNLTEEEENKFIDNFVDNNYSFLYGY